MEYSGRTTAPEHKRDDWKNNKGPFEKAIQQKTIFYVQWTDCPVEVENEVKKLWRDNELNNNDYFDWDATDDDDDNDEEKTLIERYPVIHQYLIQHNIQNCLINWWW